SMLLAGGGIRGGCTYGATDEFGMHAVENPVHVHDLHATLLHQMGLHANHLEVPGQKRLERDFGEVIREVIA
ncbi:MAG: DUF1501 domain-containing protein, partial [Verrucomicrobiae bacterium]|nr:DUF1501 domain-containing protein [Verrucomicrobiae bacterium]